MHKSVNILKAIELYTLNGWTGGCTQHACYKKNIHIHRHIHIYTSLSTSSHHLHHDHTGPSHHPQPALLQQPLTSLPALLGPFSPWVTTLTLWKQSQFTSFLFSNPFDGSHLTGVKAKVVSQGPHTLVPTWHPSLTFSNSPWLTVRTTSFLPASQTCQTCSLKESELSPMSFLSGPSALLLYLHPSLLEYHICCKSYLVILFKLQTPTPFFSICWQCSLFYFSLWLLTPSARACILLISFYCVGSLKWKFHESNNFCVPQHLEHRLT